jgi:hypothetical protein
MLWPTLSLSVQVVSITWCILGQPMAIMDGMFIGRAARALTPCRLAMRARLSSARPIPQLDPSSRNSARLSSDNSAV